jgi:hypothetical protein
MDYTEPVDDSQSVEVLDESTLQPLAEAPGSTDDNPDPVQDPAAEPYPGAGYEDSFQFPDEVPGQDTMPVRRGE